MFSGTVDDIVFLTRSTNHIADDVNTILCILIVDGKVSLDFSLCGLYYDTVYTWQGCRHSKGNNPRISIKFLLSSLPLAKVVIVS